ncbi:hypothetical protein TNCV_668141 [Trichonephila clavipes]|nr:hypothetical protein TNCV_668141 [Trichonephila clavipes]
MISDPVPIKPSGTSINLLLPEQPKIPLNPAIEQPDSTDREAFYSNQTAKGLLWNSERKPPSPTRYSAFKFSTVARCHGNIVDLNLYLEFTVEKGSEGDGVLIRNCFPQVKCCFSLIHSCILDGILIPTLLLRFGC